MLPRGTLFRVGRDTDPRSRRGVGGLLALNAYWFALSYLWQPLGIFVLPILVGEMTRPLAVHLGGLSLRFDRNTYLGVVGALGTAVAILWQPMAGALSDQSRSRWGRRRPFIAVGALGSAVALGLLAAATSLWALIAAYVLLQLASNTAQGAYQGMLPDQVPDDQRGRASAYYGAVQLLAVLVGAIVIGVVLIPRHAVVGAILSMAVLVLVMGAVTVSAVPDVLTTRASRAGAARTMLLSFAVDVRRYPDFAWLLLSRMLFLIGLLGMQQFLLYYLQALLGLSPEQASARAGLILVSGLVVSIACSFGLGYLSDRWSRKRIVMVACGLGAVCAMLLIGVRSESGLLAVGALLGAASGTFFSVDWALATDLAPREEAGRYMGLSNVVNAGAGVVAGLVMGPLISAVNQGADSTAGYRVAFVLAAILLVGAAVVLRRVREPPRGKPRS